MVRRNFSRNFFLLIIVLSVFAPLPEEKILAQEIRISWNPVNVSDVAGYKLYIGYRSRRYRESVLLGYSTEYTFTCGDSLFYYFAVTAYDTAGSEGNYSEEVVFRRGIDGGGFFELHVNYPNPFNPETRIPFVLVNPQEVRLTIYNILGEEIRVLAEGKRNAGYYTLLWDGKDTRGFSVANGVYFCNLRVGRFSQSRKIISHGENKPDNPRC